MQEVNLVEVYIADMLGIFLILGAVFSGAWKLQKKHNEDKVLFGVIILVFTACVADIIAFSVDGRPGSIFKVLSYVSSNILFIANVAIGPLWVMLISLHIYGSISKFQRVFILSISGVILLMMIVNFFVPIIFSIDENNVYARGPWFMIKNILEVVLMADGVIIYLISLFRSGGIKFYPVLQFVWPIFICVCLQMFFYGISTIWVGIAVGYTNLMLALQNENIFIDKLTGLYNRYYLDKILGELKRKRKIAMMMLDMNGFKSINDLYSHEEGDIALKSVANILKEVISSNGSIIRFAGDEFVIIIKTSSEDELLSYKNKILESFERFNNTAGKPYALSAAIGTALYDFSKGDVSDFLNNIDNLMYKDKENYYKNHDRRNSRRESE